LVVKKVLITHVRTNPVGIIKFRVVVSLHKCDHWSVKVVLGLCQMTTRIYCEGITSSIPSSSVPLYIQLKWEADIYVYLVKSLMPKAWAYPLLGQKSLVYHKLIATSPIHLYTLTYIVCQAKRSPGPIFHPLYPKKYELYCVFEILSWTWESWWYLITI